MIVAFLFNSLQYQKSEDSMIKKIIFIFFLIILVVDAKDYTQNPQAKSVMNTLF